MTPLHLRPGRPDDLEIVWTLNQAEVPAVGDATPQHLAWLAEQAERFVVAESADIGVAGFVIALGPGVDYGSPNYAFFSDRHATFLYVDRVVVGPEARGQGLGRRLYQHLLDGMQAPVLCAEVNVRPRNDGSLRFHDRLGFTPVGEQETYGGTARVRLLERPAKA